MELRSRSNIKEVSATILFIECVTITLRDIGIFHNEFLITCERDGGI